MCKPFGAGSARRSHGPAERYAHVRHRCGSEPEHVSARKPFGAGWNEWVGCLEPLPTPTLSWIQRVGETSARKGWDCLRAAKCLVFQLRETRVTRFDK